jgi:hypothetical protein
VKKDKKNIEKVSIATKVPDCGADQGRRTKRTPSTTMQQPISRTSQLIEIGNSYATMQGRICGVTRLCFGKKLLAKNGNRGISNRKTIGLTSNQVGLLLDV